MRIIKEAEERKNEILDVANELFGQKGFDGTSTNDILEKVGIARGTLYYHFKSKEDILNALIERYSTNILNMAKEISLDKNIPINERIICVVKALKVNHSGGKEVINQMHKPQNALMHQKVQQMILNSITPILTEIIKEGIEERIFNTPYPYECMEMVICYASTIFDGNIELTEQELKKRTEGFVFNVERLLGAESGSLAQNLIQYIL